MVLHFAASWSLLLPRVSSSVQQPYNTQAFPQQNACSPKGRSRTIRPRCSTSCFAGLGLRFSCPLLIPRVSSEVHEPYKWAHPNDKPTQPYTNLMHGRICPRGARPADTGTRKELTRKTIAPPAIDPHPCTPPVPWVSASSHRPRRPKQTFSPPPPYSTGNSCSHRLTRALSSSRIPIPQE